MEAVEKCAWLLKCISDHFMTQEIFYEPVRTEPLSLAYVPDYFKSQKICNKAVRNHPYTLKYVPEKLKTQEMCDDAVHKDAWLLKFVLDHFKAQKMCERAVKEDRDSLIHVPGWFVLGQKMWYIDYSHVTAPDPGAMMIGLLSGIRAIKNARLKKQT